MWKKKPTIRKIYEYTKSHNAKLLSDYNADFWEVYRSNSAYFDRIFARDYADFIPYGLDADDTIADSAVAFIADVYGVLLMNDKKYAELWRAQTIPDEDYSIIDNYNMREHLEKETVLDGEEKRAPHTDSDSATHVYGIRETESDTTTNTGSQSNESDRTTNTGAQTVESENTVSAFNSSSYEPNTKTETDNGTREDTEHIETTDGSREDTEHVETTESAHTDTDSTTRNYGLDKTERDDTTTEEYTLTRVGNIGVQTGTDMLEKHINLFERFSFYRIIFDDIANELLRL